MPHKETALKVIKIRKKNDLAVQSYLTIIKICDEDEYLSFYKKIKDERVYFGAQLDKVISEIDDVYDYFSSQITLVNGWIDIHNLVKKECHSVVLKKIIDGEELARVECNLLLAEDLTYFPNIRDLILSHLYKISMLEKSIERILQ